MLRILSSQFSLCQHIGSWCDKRCQTGHWRINHRYSRCAHHSRATSSFFHVKNKSDLPSASTETGCAEVCPCCQLHVLGEFFCCTWYSTLRWWYLSQPFVAVFNEQIVFHERYITFHQKMEFHLDWKYLAYMIQIAPLMWSDICFKLCPFALQSPTFSFSTKFWWNREENLNNNGITSMYIPHVSLS